MPEPGIDPGSLEPQSNILPLNYSGLLPVFYLFVLLLLFCFFSVCLLFMLFIAVPLSLSLSLSLFYCPIGFQHVKCLFGLFFFLSFSHYSILILLRPHFWILFILFTYYSIFCLMKFDSLRSSLLCLSMKVPSFTEMSWLSVVSHFLLLLLLSQICLPPFFFFYFFSFFSFYFSFCYFF